MPIETTLSRHLGRVTAPKELWDRVQLPRVETVAVAYPRLAAPNLLNTGALKTGALAAAVLAAMLAVVMAWGLRPHEMNLEAQAQRALAGRALASGSSVLELRSSSASEIRMWIRAHTGLDITLPQSPAPSIRLLGAHMMPAVAGRDDATEKVAEVVYRVDGHEAVLLVAKAQGSGSGPGRHHFVSGSITSGPQAHSFSWTMRGQLYTLACAQPEFLQAACRLCHADGGPQAAVN
jgi:hypothetical protein